MFTALNKLIIPLFLAGCTIAIHAQPDATASPIHGSQEDLGRVEPDFPLAGMTLHFKQSAAQQTALQQLLEDQRNPASSKFHQWLTPEQYADQFGLRPNDIAKVRAWMESQGFAVGKVARSRMWMVFSGDARHAENAFRTEIHRYKVNGQTHFANARRPTFPATLVNFVNGIDGLNDFRAEQAPLQRPFRPQMTSPTGVHTLAPDDLAVIYNIAPLYQAGIDGTGQKVAVVGSTSLRASDFTDIAAFRAQFNLPPNVPQAILDTNYPDPGINLNTLPEAHLDIEWVGSVARKAQVIYVYSGTFFHGVQYVIDQNLAPVVSASLGICEPLDEGILAFYQALARQGNAQGITWVNSSGDAGAAGCDPNGFSLAQGGLAVRFPADMPEVTGVGGTEFDEQGGSYWSATNTANGASAVSYIPETVWNDLMNGTAVWAGGGGASRYFPKPVWQVAPGVPDDNARDVPDVSLASSFSHDGYYVYRMGQAFTSGGTSASSPAFAGMVALLNQYLISKGVQSQPGVGNINPTLYRLARNTSGVFHDVTTGSNRVPCVAASPDCSNGFFGFSATPGYDQATGLGSVDAFQMVTQWSQWMVADKAPPPPSIAGVANAASYEQAFAPGMLLYVAGSQIGSAAQVAGAVPFPVFMAGVSASINGTPAPLFYVSPSQLDVQIPYEIAPGPATLMVDNLGQTASYPFTVQPSAPGIFTSSDGSLSLVPVSSGKQGQALILFITGQGQVSPAIASGAAPAPGTPVSLLPAPKLAVQVTVAGMQAPIDFAGIPAGLVGVTQINFRIPQTAPLGTQPVVVTVGSAASAPAMIIVQ